MTTTDDRPAARWELPYELIERGRTSTLRLRLFRDGAKITPSSVTVALTDASNTALTVGTPSLGAEGYEASVGSAATAGLALGTGYRVEWVATLADGRVYTYDISVALCRRVLYPTVSDFDVRRRWPHIDPTQPGSMVSRANHQQHIDDAWWTLQRRLIDMGRRPWMILGPSSLHEPHLLLAGVLIHKSLAARGNPTLLAMAEQLERDYERAMGRVTFEYDVDEDGRDDDPDSRASATSSLWLGGSPAWRHW